MPKMTKSKAQGNPEPWSNHPKPQLMVIGVDPGQKGGLAAWVPASDDMQSIPMPSSERDIVDWLEEQGMIYQNTVAVIERIWPRPTFFKGKSSILKSTCDLYGSYRMLRGILTGLKIRFYDVRPQDWQKELGFATRVKDMSDAKWKECLRAKAQQFFPNIDLWEDKTRGYKGRQMAVADALLLCEYGVRKHG